jgi:glycosyltransferase involved in cell wall biosynthesis
MTLPFISIIIPCYNASNFIIETIHSILNQDESRFEILVIDDGSTDDSKIKISTFTDLRINYFYQTNKGVSSARNNGLRHSKGNYIIFFDADDIMSPNFLSSRIKYLENNSEMHFVSGEVQKFDENGNINRYFRGTSINGVEEILLYDLEVVTCPSNYCFRKSFLINNKLTFNENLSSTADKYFLLESFKFGKSDCDSSLSKLNYRVVENSMSHKLTIGLVIDNENFYKSILKTDLVPKNIENKSLFLGNFILFASYWKVGKKQKSFKFAMRCFYKEPVEFIKKCLIKN